MSAPELAHSLGEHTSAVVGRTVDLHYGRVPELMERFGEAGREKCLQDAGYHLAYLREAVAAGSETLFVDYIGWARLMLESRGVPYSDLRVNLECLRDALTAEMGAQAAAPFGRTIDQALRVAPVAAPAAPAAPAATETDSLQRDYLEALLQGRRQHAARLVLEAVESGLSIRSVYLQVFQPAQHEIGRLWQTNRISVAQEHYCTAATQLIMSQLYPYIFATERNGLTLVATCVAGDLHELGIRMVSDLFELEGWDTFYLGANAPTRDVLQTLLERRADCLAVSATMTFHVSAVRELVSAVRAHQQLRGLKILVGGYPFNLDPELWQKVGADGHARDAGDVAALGMRLVRS